MIRATVRLDGEEDKLIVIEPRGKLSDGVRELKIEAGAHLTAYLSKHKLSKEEVNVLEEEISSGEGDDDEAANKKSKRGLKRKKGGLKT